MENLFITGGVVSANRIIGYKRYLGRDFMYRVKQKAALTATGGIYVHGLHRTGKTSLAKYAFGELNKLDNVICIYYDVNIIISSENAFADLLNVIIKQLQKAVAAKFPSKTEDNMYKISLEDFLQIESSASTTTRIMYFQAIFAALKELKIKVFLFLDEFDAVQRLFSDRSEFEVLRSLTSEPEYSVCLITISRLPLFMIEQENENNSSFKGVMQSVPVTGFDGDDIKAYRKFLLQNYEIELNDKDVGALNYYCGRSPYLYSLFGYELVSSKEYQQNSSVASIYQSILTETVDSYHTDIYRHLLNTKMDSDYSFADKLTGIVVGPSFFVRKEDVDILLQLKYLQQAGDKYITISPSFKDYLTSKKLTVSSWEKLLEVERKLKLLISQEIPAIFSNNKEPDNDDWYDLLNNCCNFEFDNSRYQRYISNNLTYYGKVSSVLDVMSLRDAVRIVSFKWVIFSKYFGGDMLDKWAELLEVCWKARNPYAHGHEDYLSTVEREHVKTYCDTILKAISETINHKCLNY